MVNLFSLSFTTRGYQISIATWSSEKGARSFNGWSRNLFGAPVWNSSPQVLSHVQWPFVHLFSNPDRDKRSINICYLARFWRSWCVWWGLCFVLSSVFLIFFPSNLLFPALVLKYKTGSQMFHVLMESQ